MLAAILQDTAQPGKPQHPRPGFTACPSHRRTYLPVPPTADPTVTPRIDAGAAAVPDSCTAGQTSASRAQNSPI